MWFFGKKSVKKNSEKLLQTCENLIEEYEKSNRLLAPSCKSDLMAPITEMVLEVKKDLDRYKETINYTRTANAMIAQTTFDLLACGRYHIYYGVLNPMNCSSNLMTVYKKSMEYGLSIGEITTEQKEEQYKYLLKCISQVG